MEALVSRPMVLIVALAVLFAALLVGQSFGDAAVAEGGFTATGTALGRAGFAYLTGLRTFAAAALWNRLDPQYHEYYIEASLHEQTQILPIVNLVVTLDPQFVDGYYLTSWILARRGDVETALDISRRGVENNPRSGLLRMSYVQILWFFGHDSDEALRQAELALAEDTEWKHAWEQHDSYAVLLALYRELGMEQRVVYLEAELQRLDEEIGVEESPDGAHHDHDHDHDHDH